MSLGKRAEDELRACLETPPMRYACLRFPALEALQKREHFYGNLLQLPDGSTLGRTSTYSIVRLRLATATIGRITASDGRLEARASPACGHIADCQLELLRINPAWRTLPEAVCDAIDALAHSLLARSVGAETIYSLGPAIRCLDIDHEHWLVQQEDELECRFGGYTAVLPAGVKPPPDPNA